MAAVSVNCFSLTPSEKICILEFRSSHGLSVGAKVRCTDDEVLYTDRFSPSFKSNSETNMRVDEAIERADADLYNQGYQKLGVYRNTEAHFPVVLYSQTVDPRMRFCLVWSSSNKFKLPHQETTRIDCNDGVVSEIYSNFSEFEKRNRLKFIGSVGSDLLPSQSWSIYEARD